MNLKDNFLDSNIKNNISNKCPLFHITENKNNSNSTKTFRKESNKKGRISKSPQCNTKSMKKIQESLRTAIPKASRKQSPCSKDPLKDSYFLKKNKKSVHTKRCNNNKVYDSERGLGSIERKISSRRRSGSNPSLSKSNQIKEIMAMGKNSGDDLDYFHINSRNKSSKRKITSSKTKVEKQNTNSEFQKIKSKIDHKKKSPGRDHKKIGFKVLVQMKPRGNI